MGIGKKDRSDLLLAAAVIASAFVGSIVFLLRPMLNGIWLSLINYSPLTQPRFAGFKNYLCMLEDPVFWNATGITIYYMVANIGI